jgi:DNA polymerase
MSERVSIDFETRSVIDLKKVGAFKYAEHPSTKVLILAIKKGRHGDTNPVLSWDVRQPPNEAVALLMEAIEKGWEIHAFNYLFEWAILKYVCPRQLGLPVPAIEQMRCTQAVCRSAGLPPSLGACADFLQLSIQKDKIGDALIQKFSKPQKKTNRFIEWSDDAIFTVGGEKLSAREAFQKFVAYCVRDVETEMAISEAVKAFELKGFPLDWFHLDARLNDRGLPVDREALLKAHDIMLQHEDHLSGRFKEITGYTPNQKARVLEWLQARGYRGANLKKETREKHGDGPSMSSEAKEAMRLAADLSYAAVKKVPAMLNYVMADGRIRGAFKWCGAQKTWRWTSSGVQIQNMKKPPKWLRKVIEEAYQDVRAGREILLLELCYGNPYELIASLARYFIRFDISNVYDLDFTSVEARVLPQLIECQRVLDRFVSGEGDIYTQTGESLTKLLKDKFNVDFVIDRDMGKTVVLATQFQGGWHAVFTATGNKWKRAWCEAAAKLVRDENPEFPQAWRRFQDSFVTAIDTPEKWHPVTKYVSVGYTKKGPFPRMLMRLASGRKICWPLPQKEPITMVKIEMTKGGKKVSTRWERINGHFTKEDLPVGLLRLVSGESVASTFKTWEISFYGHIKGKTYGRVKTYGGDMLQSATQGTAADLLAYGALEAENRGFDPILLVHDQALSEAKGDKEDFRDAMTSVPPWFEGFPLDAVADEERSYCKN